MSSIASARRNRPNKDRDIGYFEISGDFRAAIDEWKQSKLDDDLLPLGPISVPPENSMQPIAEVLSSKRIEESTGLRLCLGVMNAKFADVHNSERQFGRKFQRPKEMQRVAR